MADIKDLIQSIESGDSSFDEKLAAINAMEETLVAMRAQEQSAIDDNVSLIVEAIAVMQRKVEAQLEVAKAIVPEKGDKGDPGKPGRDGKDGLDGKNGQDGADGRNGVDGQDGVSVTDAKIDFDGSLIITLSTGREINVGEVVAPELAEKIKLVTSGGGTSQQVLDTLASLQTQINTLIPSQTGNAGKFLTTDGTNTSWATAGGGGSPFTSPVEINVNSTSSALAINQLGTGNALLVEDSSNPDSTPTVIDQFGNLIIGKDSRLAANGNKIEVHSTISETNGLLPSAGLFNWSSSSSAASHISFWHYPSGTVGTTTTANASGNVLGRIRFFTQDGAGASYSGGISATTASDLTSVNLAYSANSHSFTGPITSGTWNGSIIDVAYGGTGTATPSLVAGTNVTITGTWPNQTIAASGGGGGSSTLTIDNKTATYTVVAGDLAKVINCTSGTFTVSLTAAATLGAGFNVTIWNTSATASNVITIDPNGAETIDGVATLILRRGEGMQIVCDGTNWQTGDKKTMRAYVENLLSTGTRPIASGNNSVALMNNSTASSDYGLALGFIATVNGAESIATHRSTAGSNYSAAIGENSAQGGAVTASGGGAMALGGSYASGADSFAAAVANNTSSFGATGANSVALGATARATSIGSVAISANRFGNAQATANGAVAIGDTALASGALSVALGRSVTASASNSAAIGGDNLTASGSFSVALGGSVNTASGESSYAFGVRAIAAEVGKIAWGAFSSSTQGSSQAGMIVLRADTTDATASVLRSNGNAAGAVNQVILRNNSAYAFTGTVVARRQASGGTESAAWKVEGLIRREANAASTTLVFSTVVAISNVPLWGLALSADTTNGGLAVTATGAATTNIRWAATINTSEVTFA
jgi:trimeric autotransporter adhesin